MIPESPTPLAKRVAENPLQFFSFEECAEIFGFSRSTMTAIAAAGAPVVARKMNPAHLGEWLRENAALIGKINS